MINSPQLNQFCRLSMSSVMELLERNVFKTFWASKRSSQMSNQISWTNFDSKEAFFFLKIWVMWFQQTLKFKVLVSAFLSDSRVYWVEQSNDQAVVSMKISGLNRIWERSFHLKHLNDSTLPNRVVPVWPLSSRCPPKDSERFSLKDSPN